MPAPALPPAPLGRAAEQSAQPTEGPVATASLAPPLPPARPPVSAAPQSQPTAPQNAAAVLQAPAPPGSLKTDATAAIDCLPGHLRAVLADLAAQFGNVTVVSTHQLNTTNHSSGSIREQLHHDCKAVDIRPDRSRIEDIKAYLRTRREIGGVESYRNGIVHIDTSGATIAARQTSPRPARLQASTGAPSDAVQAAPLTPQEAQARNPLAPVINERYR